ncbi:adhesion regulating molecule [Rhizophagus irregularis]|uniref:Adhesion regulating molecule n=1 Tax=Rhizophagus irregularis TaxID=588596 RepID=A0A2N1NZT2_9GLOM|nr:adhesion regulating molecule [Rhizophagus irregularis]
MATSLFPTPVPRRKYPVEFKAGKLKRDGNTNWLKADERKGLVYMDQGDDQLMHFYWKDRKNNAVEDDLILFPEEAEFIRVEQCTTGRVYLLNFKSSSRKLFFWMQDAKDDKDEENVAKVNRLINDPQAGLAESRQQQSSAGQLGSPFQNMQNMDDLAGFGMDQEQLLQLLQGQGFGGPPFTSTTPAEPQSATAATSEAGSGVQTTESNLGFTSEQLGNLRNILSGIQVPGTYIEIKEGTRQPDVSLVDVLTPSAIGPLLNNPEIASALFPHLPANIERSPEELAAVIQSPQFAQALQSLSIALQSGQLGPLLSQLGLDPSAGNGVEAFLRAIQEQANRRHRDHEDENTEDHSGDRMEED